MSTRSDYPDDDMILFHCTVEITFSRAASKRYGWLLVTEGWTSKAH